MMLFYLLFIRDHKAGTSVSCTC
uniref:Uncharacterized protein n=1 Tax=Anguilla anguilla TaxID=7936 RepID=A0A0E9V6H1_ANGAN